MKSINGPLQDLWLTRAGGDRPVGTPDGLGHVLPFSIPACQGRPPIFFEISGCIARFFRNPLRPWWPLFVLWRASSRGRPFEGFPDASPGVLQGTRIKATKGGVCIEELQK